MKKILISTLSVVIGLLAVSQAAFAASAVLSASPSIATSTAGTSFTVTAQIDPAGNKVCVVKGTINFTNLFCQNITLANGVMAQTAPTCAAPNFTIGIPKCTTAVQNLFSVSVSGIQAGQASSSFVSVKVIGAGTDVPFYSQNGLANIVATLTHPEPEVRTTVVVSPVTSKPGQHVPVQHLTTGTGATGSSTEPAATSTATSTGTSTSFISGLSATVLDALGSAAGFIGRNKVLILSILVILLLISQITMWVRIRKEKEDQNQIKE